MDHHEAYPEGLSQEQFLWLQKVGNNASPTISLAALKRSPCPLQPEWFKEVCVSLKTESPREARLWLPAAYGIKAVGFCLEDLSLAAYAQAACARLARMGAQWQEALKEASEAKLLAVSLKDALLESECGLIEGAVYTETGRFHEALASYQEAMQLYEKLGDLRGLASCHFNAGLIHFRMGRIHESLTRVDKARSLFQEIGHLRNIGVCLMTLGNAHRHLGHWMESLTFYKQARKIFEGIDDRRRIASCYLNAGNVYSDIDRLSEARSMYEKALGVFESLGEQGRVGGCHLNMGLTYLQSGQAEEALHRCHLARPLFEDLDDAMRIAECDLYEGLTLAQLGSLESALPFYLSAKDFFETVGDTRQVALCLFHQGNLLRRQGRLEEAFHIYERALVAIESFRETTPYPEFAQGLTRALEGLGAAIVSCLIALNRSMEAFKYAQRAKGAALRNAMIGAPTLPLEASLNDQEVQRLHALRNDYEAARLLFQQTPLNTPAHMRRLSDCQRCLAELSAYETLLRARHAQSRGMEAYPVDLEGVKSALSDSMGVLEILIDESHLCLLLLTAQESEVTIHAERIGINRAELRKETQRYLHSLSQNGSDSDSLARWLFDHLLKPIESQIRVLKTLIVCPDQFLHPLPFGALIDSEGLYLIQRLAIAVAPSASAWEACRRISQERAVLSAPLVVALSNFGTDPVLENSSMRPLLSEARLRDLPHALEEARSISKILGEQTRMILEERATLEAVKCGIKEASLIHFATHALTHEAAPMMSALVLASNESGEPGIFYARDISEMRLQARLTVLSACSTIQGHFMSGEGLMGLAWAFMRAGCPATLATCWSAHDHAARLWVEAFYQASIMGSNNAESARSACLQLLQSHSYSNPHYWANWILIGSED